MDEFDVFTPKPSTQEDNTFEHENIDKTTSNQMDEFDVFTPKPSTQEDNAFEHANIDKTTSDQMDDKKNNNPIDDYSWIHTDNSDISAPFQSDGLNEDNITSSQTAYNENLFELPPTVDKILSDDLPNKLAEDKYSYNLFSNEELSPLYAITKKRAEEIAAKDAVENEKIEELRQQAKNDLERWYNERQKQIEQKIQIIRNEETAFNAKLSEKSTKESCDWSKVIRLLDFTDGTQYSKSKRDLTRMKACMFNAKRINDQKKLPNGN